MTTEVRIKKSRIYLPHLRKIVSSLAVGLGMSRDEVRDAEEAVHEVCVSSIRAAEGDGQGSLCIKLHTCDNCMTVDICDPACCFTPPANRQWLVGAASAGTFQKLRLLADEIQFMPADDGATVRLTKYVREAEDAVSVCLSQSPTSTLQV